jgi:GNAT superfamily N-acetyltransferase
MEQLQAISLIKASEEDAEELADISRRAFHTDVDCGSPWGESGPPGYDSPQAQARLMRECDYYKIVGGGAIVGAIMAIRRGDRHYECCGLFVDPQVHNRGIATAAFDLIWEMVPDAKRWTVGTPAWNTRTNHFYRKLGFVKVGEDGPDGVIYEKMMDGIPQEETR